MILINFITTKWQHLWEPYIWSGGSETWLLKMVCTPVQKKLKWHLCAVVYTRMSLEFNPPSLSPKIFRWFVAQRNNNLNVFREIQKRDTGTVLNVACLCFHVLKIFLSMCIVHYLRGFIIVGILITFLKDFVCCRRRSLISRLSTNVDNMVDR